MIKAMSERRMHLLPGTQTVKELDTLLTCKLLYQQILLPMDSPGGEVQALSRGTCWANKSIRQITRLLLSDGKSSPADVLMLHSLEIWNV